MADILRRAMPRYDVSTLLEILQWRTLAKEQGLGVLFQPFLRFYRSYVRFLRVFKFFFSFL